MKHLKKGRKFGRIKKQREALLKILLGDLLMKRKIKTTLAKAKELKGLADRTISQLKKTGNLRLVLSKLPSNVTSKTIKEIATKTASRQSGYVRITKKANRLSDSAKMAVVEIIEDEIIPENKKK